MSNIYEYMYASKYVYIHTVAYKSVSLSLRWQLWQILIDIKATKFGMTIRKFTSRVWRDSKSNICIISSATTSDEIFHE